MAALSVVLGCLVAGRVLRPLRTITARTRRISEQSLHDRLALPGPRDELRQLADTIDELLERLEAAFDAQRQFVANASHELRTPLAMMRTRLDVAIAKPNGIPPQTAALDIGLRRDLDRAEQLLETFLALARAQHGAVHRRGTVSLDRAATDALAARHDRIAEQQLEVDTRRSNRHGSLAARRCSGRMVDNYENAVRHNQPHGSFDIACDVEQRSSHDSSLRTAAPSSTRRIVADLVRPFQRAGGERTGSRNGQRAGTGGRRGGHGRAQRRTRAPRAPRRRPRMSRSGSRCATPINAANVPGMRVLVVEDEPEFANDDRRGAPRSGHRRRCRLRRTQGRRQTQSTPYDVVVLDRDLPGLHGDPLCRVITVVTTPRWS